MEIGPFWARSLTGICDYFIDGTFSVWRGRKLKKNWYKGLPSLRSFKTWWFSLRSFQTWFLKLDGSVWDVLKLDGFLQKKNVVQNNGIGTGG